MSVKFVHGVGRFAYQTNLETEPNTNRMVSPDTIVPDPTNPQSFNRYSYVRNNPVNRIDPTGHRSCSAAQAASGDETCDQNIPSSPSMPSASSVGFNSSNTDPLPLLFYENPHHFQMTAGIEYYAPGLSEGASLLTPFIGQGAIPDIPGVIHEGYPVSFSIADRDGDGIVEWVRYIEVGGEVQILFAAEWQLAGGVGYETFPIPAVGNIPIVESVSTTLVLIPQFHRPGSIILRGEAILGAGHLPSGTYIEFETTQTSATTIETVGSLMVDHTTVAQVSFRGTYDPSRSTMIAIPPNYNISK